MHASTMNTGSNSLRTVFDSMLSAIGSAIETRRRYNQTLTELRALNPRELGELGIAPADFHTIAKGKVPAGFER